MHLLEWKLPPAPLEIALAGTVNLSVDGVRFMLAFFVGVLCGAVLRQLKTPWGAICSLNGTLDCVCELFSAPRRLCAGRQLFSIASGFLLCAYVFGAGVLHGLFSIGINWAVLHLIPQHASVAGWAINFPHLAVWCALASEACSEYVRDVALQPPWVPHIVRSRRGPPLARSHMLSGDTWKRGDLDFTGALMIIFLKMVCICTNRCDGYHKRGARISDYLRERALATSPSLIELTACACSMGALSRVQTVASWPAKRTLMGFWWAGHPLMARSLLPSAMLSQ